jgi:hypothetical protein
MVTSDAVLVVNVPVLIVPSKVMLPVPFTRILPVFPPIVPELSSVQPVNVNVLEVGTVKVAPLGITNFVPEKVRFDEPREKFVELEELAKVNISFTEKLAGTVPVPS